MPTGYTAPVQSGEVTDIADFAMQCARAFGALVTMRDEPGREIPVRFEPSTEYHDRALEKAERTLREVNRLTDRECAERARADYERASEAWAENGKKRAADRARYEAMLNMVRLWDPPTPEHAGMRRFMETQLMESIDFDCEMGAEYRSHPRLKTGHEWRMEELETARREIEYHSRERAKEIERTNERNEWLSQLRSSLGLEVKRDAESWEEVVTACPVSEQVDEVVRVLKSKVEGEVRQEMSAHCCDPDCGEDAEFEIVGGSGHFEDVTHACAAHVGSLLGTPEWVDKDNESWVVHTLGGP